MLKNILTSVWKVFADRHIKHQLYASDKEERYFHIYYSDQKSDTEHEQLECMVKYLDKIKGKPVSFSGGYNEYYHLEIYDKNGTFLGYWERKNVIERELEQCGYFVIVTSRKMHWSYIRAGMSRKNYSVEIRVILVIRVFGFIRMNVLLQRYLLSLLR